MIPLGPVVARQQVAASRETVWHFIVDEARRSEWFAGLQFGAARAAVVSTGDKQGVLDVFIRGHVLGFKWAEAEQLPTSVILTLRTVSSGTLVTVTETGFDALREGAAAAAAAQQQWNQALQTLAAADFSEVAVPELYADHEAALAAAAAAADQPVAVSAAEQDETAQSVEPGLSAAVAPDADSALSTEPALPGNPAPDTEAQETLLPDLDEPQEKPLPELGEAPREPQPVIGDAAGELQSELAEVADIPLPDFDESDETVLPDIDEVAAVSLPESEHVEEAQLLAAEPDFAAPAAAPATAEQDAFAELFGESFATGGPAAAPEQQQGRPDPTLQKQRDLPKRKWWQL